MRKAWVILLAITLAAPVSAAAPSPVDDFAGVYKTQFKNGLVSGEQYTSENILEIVKVSPSQAYIRVHLDFFNGHQCAISGVAKVERATLVYRPRETYGDKPCELRLSRQGEKLVFKDAYSCNGYCGARGTLEGASFPISAKRPIRYMDRLLKSPEYAAALAER